MSTQDHLLNLCTAALAAGSMKNAIAACRELNSRYPDYLEGWLIAGDIHQHMGKPQAGLIAADRALAIAPGHPSAILQKVDCLLATEQDQAAIALLDTLPDVPFAQADQHDRAGRILATLDRHEEARSHYEGALALEPDSPSLWYNLATAQRFLGETEAAQASLNRALELNPLDFEAQAMRSSLRKQREDDNHVDELLAVLDDPGLPAPGRVNIQFALAKELDDLGRYPDAFAHLKSGADARRRQMRYDVSADIHLIDRIIDTFDDAYMATGAAGCDSAEPIFILGMPRTGTTLVERILSSHSSIYAAGELDTFGRELMRQLDSIADLNGVDQAARIQLSRAVDPAALGSAYIEGTRTLTGNTPHFIDKLPFNFLYAGLIRRALPRAKIINLERHPMATGYAVYKQLFRDAYPFSYDLEDLGRYYVAYRKLMDHWDEVMPGAIYRVSYEAVVDDIERETRGLLDYCGLPWEDSCLAFHKNAQASTTASASQVRQPIYRGSLNHWQHYQAFLEPFRQIIESAGIDVAPVIASNTS